MADASHPARATLGADRAAPMPGPSLDALAADLSQAAQLPPDVARAALAAVAGLIPVLVAASGGPSAGPAPVEDRLLTARETAAQLGIPVKFAYELIRRGVVPSLPTWAEVRPGPGARARRVGPAGT